MATRLLLRPPELASCGIGERDPESDLCGSSSSENIAPTEILMSKQTKKQFCIVQYSSTWHRAWYKKVTHKCLRSDKCVATDSPRGTDVSFSLCVISHLPLHMYGHSRHFLCCLEEEWRIYHSQLATSHHSFYSLSP